MPSEILLGLDLGTTALKAAAFDARSGRVLASAARRLALHLGPRGERDQDAAGLDGALRSVAAELRRKLGRGWAKVAGLGLAAQGGSGLIADRASGRAFTPLYLWNDPRAFPYLSKVTKGVPAGFWRRRTMRDVPGSGLGRLLWLQETRPKLFTRDNLYVGAGEYAFHLLTGLWRQDACNALQIGCYNVPADRLDPELLSLVGLTTDFVAPLRRGHEVNALSRGGARLLGLREGLPVAGPYMDHEAGFLSAAGVSRRPMQCSLGTAWVGNFAVEKRGQAPFAGTALQGAAHKRGLPPFLPTSPVQLVLPAVVGQGHLVVQPLLTGNVTWDWALATFVDRDHKKALGKLDSIFGRELLPPDGLVALPWLNMPNPLRAGALGGGAFLGMNTRTGSHELLRAVALGMCCETFRVFREVKERGKVDSLVLGGGASKGGFFRSMLAALFAPLPVYQPRDEDFAGARGTLHAFGASQPPLVPRRVPLPGRDVRSRIERALGLYLETFERVYGEAALGRPISFGTRIK